MSTWTLRVIISSVNPANPDHVCTFVTQELHRKEHVGVESVPLPFIFQHNLQHKCTVCTLSQAVLSLVMKAPIYLRIAFYVRALQRPLQRTTEVLCQHPGMAT